MSRSNHKDFDLDEAVAQVVNEPVDPAEIEAAAARVWQRLSSQNAAALPAAAAAGPVQEAPAGTLHGCADFQSLIPAYLRGELAPARALLLEDHTRSCVPCRRALREAREGKATEARPAAAAPSRRSRAVWMSLAAMLLLVVGAGAFLALQEMLAGGGRMARVESVEGSLFRVAGQTIQPLGAGDRLDEGELVRTAKGSEAVLRMEDGSLIEMNQRAGLTLDAGRKGNTIRLEGGQVIVHAAKQRKRHLYVATNDALVSVTGTIFSVNSGTKGTRVSVVEGEVRVEQARKDNILHPGDQVTTHASVAAVPIGREIAWSRNRAEYEELLAELTALGRDIDAQVERPGLRTSTRLLDLAPEGATAYIALPNLSRSLNETQSILDQRIAENPTLRQWWSETLGSSDNEREFHDLIQKIGDLGRYLGDEVAIALVTEEGTAEGPVLLAEVTNEASFRAVLEQEVASHDGARDHLLIVTDPANLPAGSSAGSDKMLLWVGDGLFVATPSPVLLRRVAASLEGLEPNPFTSTAFHARVAEAYRDGAGWLFAADLKQILRDEGRENNGQSVANLEALGVLDMEHFLLDRREIDGHVDTRASLTFDQARRGIASWLAAPAAMGSLNFFSPDANLVASFVVKSPVALIDDLLTFDPDFATEIAKLRTEHGFDLRADLAAPLGGEVALGIDGPLVPTPSWKLAAEVYDPSRLQATFERMVEKLDAELRRNGKPGVALTEQASGGHTWYKVASADNKLSIHYVFDEGYLVAAPSRALLDRALQQRASGVTLASSAKLRDLLGPDGQVNVSALLYQNLAPVLESASRLLPGSMGQGNGNGNRHGGDPATLARMMIGSGPSVGYVYGYEDRIVAGSSSESPLGLNLQTLSGFGGILGMMSEAGEGAGDAIANN